MPQAGKALSGGSSGDSLAPHRQPVAAALWQDAVLHA